MSCQVDSDLTRLKTSVSLLTSLLIALARPLLVYCLLSAVLCTYGKATCRLQLHKYYSVPPPVCLRHSVRQSRTGGANSTVNKSRLLKGDKLR